MTDWWAAHAAATRLLETSAVLIPGSHESDNPLATTGNAKGSHFAMMSAVESTKPHFAGQCQRVLADGRRCTHSAAPGCSYCHVHR